MKKHTFRLFFYALYIGECIQWYTFAGTSHFAAGLFKNLHTDMIKVSVMNGAGWWLPR